MIIDREIDIIQKLQELILGHETLLRDCSEVCANLDCILALAETARLNNYCRPVLTESGELDIVAGIHPLIESCVANGLRLIKPVVLITGPNSSGKSIFLKQIVLIVYLAHVGSFVPAGRAVVPVFDSILLLAKPHDSVTKVWHYLEFDSSINIGRLESKFFFG